MSYYNTTSLRGQPLKSAEKKSLTQDEAILHLFQSRTRDFTPSEVKRILDHTLNNPPLTSIRRSISSLTKSGNLIKTDKKRVGSYGRLEYAWRYKYQSVCVQGSLFDEKSFQQ